MFISRMLAARAARSICGGGGVRERGVSLLAGSWVVIVAVSVAVVILSLLRCDEIGGFIVRMLAARAARSMHGGGGAREMKVVGVVGLERVRNNGRGVVIHSWLLEV